MNEQITFVEFKAWFKGFLEGKDGVALETCDIERIKMMLDSVVEDIQPTITQPIVVQPISIPYIAPIILPSPPPPVPWTSPWCGDGTGTGDMPPGVVKKYFTTCVSSGDAVKSLSNNTQLMDMIEMQLPN